MADQKISQLTDGGASQATDEYVIARSGANYRIDGASVAAAATSVGTLTSLAVSGDITASAGSSTDPSITFSGYTNWGFGIDGTGLRVVAGGAGTTTTFTTSGLTTSNAAVTGDLTVDTSTLKVDSTNNRVGIGTASPSVALDVVGALTVSGNITASGGTANGVGYLNASKVFTTGSAFQFDGTSVILGTNTSNYGLLNLSRYTSAPYASLTITDQATPANEVGIYLRANGSNPVGISSAGAPIAFYTAGPGTTERMRLDSSGNLGLGVTPSAWNSTTRAIQVGNTGAGIWAYTQAGTSQEYVHLVNNSFLNASGQDIYIGDGPAAQYQQVGASHYWYTAASGTAGNAITFTQAMTLDASGRLGIGTTAPGNYDAAARNLVIGDASGAVGLTISAGSSSASGIHFADGTAGTAAYAGYISYSHSSDAMVFATAAAERARITSGGYFKASNDGTYYGSAGAYHELRTNTSNYMLYASSIEATTPYGIKIDYPAAAPNGTGSPFIYCTDGAGGGTLRAEIRSNGGLANYQANNVDLSDARTKTEITPLNSMWDKVAALEIVSYKYVDQTHDDINLGVIAQQVETVEPVWVDTDGFGETPEGEEPFKAVYNKDITFAAIKALQEAMARIEALEARLAVLEA